MKTNELNWLLAASAYESPRLRSVDLRSGGICLTSIKGEGNDYSHQGFDDEEDVDW